MLRSELKVTELGSKEMLILDILPISVFALAKL